MTLDRSSNRPATAAWLGLAAWLVSGRGIAADGSSSQSLATRHRQPVALAFFRDGTTLLVANQRSGSISVVDTATSRVVSEHDVGRGLSDFVMLPDGCHG